MYIANKKISTVLYIFIAIVAHTLPVFAADNSVAWSDSHVVVKNETPQGDFQKIIIPLKRVQNLFLIEATIDSIKGNFILDTGAPNLVLNKTYFKNWKIADGVTSYGITGGGTQVYSKIIDTLSIQQLYFTSIHADVINLGHLEDAKGVKILGLLGANLFQGMEIEIDMQNSVLYLYKLDENGNRLFTDDSSGIKPDIDMKIDVVNNVVFLNASVGEKKLRLCLDTGAETNVLSNTVSNKVLKHFSIVLNKARLSGTGSESLDVLSGQLDQIRIGDQVFDSQPFYLTNLMYLLAVYNTYLDGIIGYPFFEQGKVVINFKKKTLLMYFYKEKMK